MTRIRTGIARRPDGPEDANPMNRRLPAEVVSRRKGENRAHPGKAVKEEVAPSHLSTDLKQVLAMKPEARSKWLAKAVQQAHPQDGRLSPKSIYDIIAHAKFANDLNEKMGQRMYRVLHANLSLFSTKQQKFLEKECALAKQFAVAAFAPVPGAEEEDTTAADAMEDMMARCRAFVRERQSERGERTIQEGEEAEAEAAEAAEIPPVGAPQALQAPDAKQATQDEAAELREANAETPFEQPISQAEPQKEADGPLTRASKSRSRSRSSPSKTKDATAGSQEKDVKDAKDEASKLKKASKPESKENGKGKTSEKPKSKEGKDTKDTKASDKAKKSKDEVSRDQSREPKTKNAKSSKEKAKESRRRENHKRRSGSSQSSRGRARDESESSRSRRRSDKRRGKKSRNSSDSSSFVSRKRGRSSSSRPKRRR